MSDETVTMTMSLAAARHLRERTTEGVSMMVPSDMNQQVHEAVTAALTEHDAKHNPLGLPWEAHPPPDGKGWTVRGVCNDDLGRGVHCLATSDRWLNEAQARLMAAAPELADALEELMQDAAISGRAGSMLYDSAKAALAKAGRK